MINKPTTDNRQPTIFLKIGLFLLLVVSGWLLVGVSQVFAAETQYKLLQPIPIQKDGSTVCTGNELVTPGNPNSGCKTTPSKYISGIFMLLIALAGVLAVVMIIFGGIKYMSTDAFTEKSDAKTTIQNAIWGLALAMGAWLILFTINPTIFKGISLGQIPAPSSSTGGGSTGGVGCLGNCPFSYVNSSGVTIRYRECSSCSEASSFGLSIKTSTVDGKQVQINTDLGNNLKALRDTSGNPAFQVTETWPPTVNHKSQQQYDGTSVDVSLSSPSAKSIETFANNAKAKGLRAVYEVGTEKQRTDYIAAGLPFGVSIIVVPYITGEHFSVYKK